MSDFSGDDDRGGSLMHLFPPSARADAFDRIEGIERRLGSLETLLLEVSKDIKTVLGIKDQRVNDLDERANQLERDVIEHRQAIGKLEQAAQKRLKKARTK
jgi:hypothetical protein